MNNKTVELTKDEAKLVAGLLAKTNFPIGSSISLLLAEAILKKCVEVVQPNKPKPVNKENVVPLKKKRKK